MSNNSKKGFNSLHLDYDLFIQWCKENNKSPNKTKNKRDFFRLILDGRLIKDEKKLIKKKVRKKEK